jgi:hypothetical protein
MQPADGEVRTGTSGDACAVGEVMADSARPVRHALAAPLALVAVAAALVSGCGAAQTRGAAGAVGLDGVSIELPPGWDGYATHADGGDRIVVIWAASTPFSEASGADFPHEALAALPADGIAVEIVAQPPQVDSASWTQLAPPLRLADGYFLGDSYKGQPAANVSTQIIQARLGDRALYVQVFFGRNEPSEAMRARANEVLGALSVAGSLVHEEREAGFVRFDDPEFGVSGRYPAGWHRARAISNLVSPREVLVLATYPLRDRAKAGECAPDTARADMPPGGAFVWLLEYRPARGEVWGDLPRDRFPPKPDRFELTRGELGANNSCFEGPTYRTVFRAADRPLQLLVAFGGDPTDERLAELSEILTSLRFEELPPPPPDPYAGWPILNDNPGDSFQPPPGWAAAAALFPPDKTPRPRTLFFASNRPLFGLPDRLVQRGVDMLPTSPSWAVANEFPADGVLVWVTEEPKGDTSPEFRTISRGWPSRDDFRPVQILTKANPDVHWLRAGGSWMGFRFSVLVGRGLKASEEDLALALKSGQSLEVSGCWRDSFDDCPDE